MYAITTRNGNSKEKIVVFHLNNQTVVYCVNKGLNHDPELITLIKVVLFTVVGSGIPSLLYKTVTVRPLKVRNKTHKPTRRDITKPCPI